MMIGCLKNKITKDKVEKIITSENEKNITINYQAKK